MEEDAFAFDQGSPNYGPRVAFGPLSSLHNYKLGVLSLGIRALDKSVATMSKA